MEKCEKYVGLACIDGTCPMALSDVFEDMCIPLVSKCSDCFYYRGCEDCALADTEYCNSQSNVDTKKK